MFRAHPADSPHGLQRSAGQSCAARKIAEPTRVSGAGLRARRGEGCRRGQSLWGEPPCPTRPKPVGRASVPAEGKAVDAAKACGAGLRARPGKGCRRGQSLWGGPPCPARPKPVGRASVPAEGKAVDAPVLADAVEETTPVRVPVLPAEALPGDLEIQHGEVREEAIASDRVDRRLQPKEHRLPEGHMLHRPRRARRPEVHLVEGAIVSAVRQEVEPRLVGHGDEGGGGRRQDGREYRSNARCA